jgi:hypothetical protein
MNYFIILIIAIIILVVNIYFTRWVFRIDEIIKIQKEQNQLLKIISEKIEKKPTIINEEKNISVQKNSKFLLDRNVCPACQTPINERAEKCINCGLIINE